MSETPTSTHLDNGFWELDGSIEASSMQGTFHLDQWGVGQVDLSPEAQYDLLRILYARRGALYRSTTLDSDGQYAPDGCVAKNFKLIEIMHTQSSPQEKTRKRCAPFL